MSCVTVFLTVSFITFLDCLTGLAAVPPLKTAIGMGGDFDIVIMPNMNRLKSIKKPLNYYNDQWENFESLYMNKKENQDFMTSHRVRSMVPFINYTEVQEHV